MASKKIRTYVLLLIFAIGLTASCANFTFRFVYNRLDTMIVDRVDDMFGLSDTQETFLKKEASDFLSWHRNTELPKYIGLLNRIKKKSEGEITTADIKKWRREIRLIFVRAGNKITPASAEFLTTIEDAQVDNLEKWFKEYNQKYIKSLAKEKHARYEERLKKSMDLLDDFFGEFSEEQKDQYSDMIDEMPDMLAPFHNVRVKRQRQLVDLLEDDSSEKEYLSWMQRLFAGSRAVANGKDRATFDEWYDKMPQFIVNFWGMLTDTQKAYFRSQLNVWIGRLAYAKNN